MEPEIKIPANIYTRKERTGYPKDDPTLRFVVEIDKFRSKTGKASELIKVYESLIAHLKKVQEENPDAELIIAFDYYMNGYYLQLDAPPSAEEIAKREKEYIKRAKTTARRKATMDKNKKLKAEKEAEQMLKRLDRDPVFKAAVLAKIDLEE